MVPLRLADDDVEITMTGRHPWLMNLLVTILVVASLAADLVSVYSGDSPAVWLGPGLIVGSIIFVAATWLRYRNPLLLLSIVTLTMPVLHLATTGLAQDLPVNAIPLEEDLIGDFNIWTADPPLPFGSGLAGMLLLGTVAVRCRARVTWPVFLVLSLFNSAATALWVPREDLWYQLIPHLLIDLVIVLVGINLRVRRLRLKELAERNRQLVLEREMHEQLAVTAERARIAREMHDIVAHSLSVMITLAEGASAVLDKQPAQAKQALDEITNVGRASLADARRLVGVLREGRSAPERTAAERNSPSDVHLPPLHQGGHAAASPAPGSQVEPASHAHPVAAPGQGDSPLEPQPTARDIPALVERFRSAGLPVEYSFMGTELPDDAFLHLTIFRIVQEGLTNVLRHAPGSQRITVAVIRQPHSVTITVENDASALPSTISGSQRGLIGIRERAAAYSGTVEAGPTPTGWLLQVPLHLG